jgi:hypothetical protein
MTFSPRWMPLSLTLKKRNSQKNFWIHPSSALVSFTYIHTGANCRNTCKMNVLVYVGLVLLLYSVYWGRILGRTWDKSLKEFSSSQKWFETGLKCKHCIRKPETSTNCTFMNSASEAEIRRAKAISIFCLHWGQSPRFWLGIHFHNGPCVSGGRKRNFVVWFQGGFITVYLVSMKRWHRFCVK